MKKAVRCWVVTVLLAFCGKAGVAQRVSLLATPYTPGFTTGTVESFLENIRQKTGVTVSYSSSTVARQRTATLTGAERTVGAALSRLFAGEGAQLVERRSKILIVAATVRERPAPTHTVSGTVRDSGSKELLIGAVVQVPALRRGITTNFYGFYCLSLPEGRHTLVTSYPGSRPDTEVVDIRADLHRTILLSPQTALEEVKVTETKRTPADRTRLSPLDISRKAAPLGESDLLRALQRTAGVQSATDGGASLLVRGGDAGQNLHLLDGVPLYYVDHFGGITSVFNTDALKSVDFYKGGFPARYGGRVSSVVDVAARDGNMERWGGSASLGLLKGSAVIEGPLIKERASVMIAARRTWVDLLVRAFTDDVRVNFSDVNAKANYILNKNHRFYLSGYTGRDKLGVSVLSTEDDADFLLREGNNTASLKWTAVFSPKLFLHTTLTYGAFRHQLSAKLSEIFADSITASPRYTGRSTMTDAGLSAQAHWYPSARHGVEVGARVATLRFAPAAVAYFDETGAQISSEEAPDFRTTEVIWHVENVITLSPKWMLRPGIHWATWAGQDYRYTSPQLRMYAAFTPGSRHTIYASAAQMTQYLHFISSGASTAALSGATPSNLWVPSTARLQPEESLTGSLGWNGRAGKHHAWSVEGYYKHMKGLLDYRDANGQFYASAQWERGLVAGTGWSYGAEASVQERVGPLHASAAYTLSWTWRKFPGINSGKAFPFRYDRRHTIKTDVLYEPTKRFNVAVAWTFLSGEAFSLPDEMYPDFDNNLPVGGGSSPLALHYSARNNHRLTPIHRLDFAVAFTKPLRRRAERTWTIGLFNAYARRNPVAPVLALNNDGIYSLQNTASFRLLPTVVYRRTF